MSCPARLLAASLALMTTSACAGLGGDEGGAANLPNRGILPYERHGDVDESPYVLAGPSDTLTVYRGVSAITDGDRVELYLEIDDPERALPFIARSAGDGTTFEPPVEVLADAGSPSIARDSDDRLWLAYLDPVTGAIGLASSVDGVDFSVENPVALRLEAPLVAERPSVVPTDDGILIYYGVRSDPDSAPTIAMARAGADLTFVEQGEVLTAGSDCLNTEGEPEECWDVDGVTGPEVRVATTATGRRLFRMFYVGIDGGDSALGFAASTDGRTFSRFPFNPIVDSRYDERSPSNVRQGDRYLLFFIEERTLIDLGVVLAINAPEAASDRF